MNLILLATSVGAEKQLNASLSKQKDFFETDLFILNPHLKIFYIFDT